MAKGAQSKADAVYGELKSAILTGALEAGSLIDKALLCEKLGVSRYPVSVAIGRLAYDGLVDVAPQHGSFVSRISIGDVLQRLFIRNALEGEIAAEAARRMSAPDKQALKDNLEAQGAAVNAGDKPTFYALDVAFHQQLVASLAMDRVGEALDGLRSHLERVRRLLMAPPGRLRETLDEHQAIAAAIEAGDAEGARAAMSRHLDATVALVDTVAAERPGLFAP